MQLKYVRAMLLMFYLLLSVSTAGWGQSNAVSPADCVNVRYIAGVWMGDQGKQIAYLVKTPDKTSTSSIFEMLMI
jgi:hypothetical protein